MAGTFDFIGADGTRLRGWSNGGLDEAAPTRPTVLICNGLGAPPAAWPSLLDPDSGYSVLTWYHRGTGGGTRPEDVARIRVDDHVDDAVALLDQMQVERALVPCWSIGVNVAFELARRHPDRVAGLLAVAGVPGGTFEAFFGPLHLPRAVRAPLGKAIARTASALGPVLGTAIRAVPLNALTVRAASLTGFILPTARPALLRAALEEYREHDFRWYFDLALAASEHEAMDLSSVTCPVILVAGRYDLLTSMESMERAAAQLPDAELRALRGSHFLPLEQPAAVRQALDDLAARALASP